jgi:hypothetical protein
LDDQEQKAVGLSLLLPISMTPAGLFFAKPLCNKMRKNLTDLIPGVYFAHHSLVPRLLRDATYF